MRRPTLRGIAAALLLVTALSAAAAAATFEGRATDDRKVNVEFRKSSGEIKRFRIERARFACTDGYTFRDGTRLGEMAIRRTDSGKRRFRGQFMNSAGNQRASVRGRLHGDRRATGSFRLIAFFRDGGACDTHVVRWSARIPATK